MKPDGSKAGEGDGGSGWTAEAEAPVLWWWETDDAARVPWGLARFLGLLLRWESFFLVRVRVRGVRTVVREHRHLLMVLCCCCRRVTYAPGVYLVLLNKPPPLPVLTPAHPPLIADQ